MIKMIKHFIFYLLMLPVYSFIYYLLFKLFNYFKLYKIALYCLSLSYAPILTEKKAIKQQNYCRNFVNKDCKNCRLWTCKGDFIEEVKK